MGKNEELVRLEQFVDSLLNKYNELKDRFHALEATLRERDDECAALKADIAELTSERSEVGSRVSNLIDRIEQWENEQDVPVEEAPQEGKQGTLFEAEVQESN